MRVLDLFSGIGGFSLGLERAGMRTVAFCEIDEYAQAVLKKHWPTVPIFGDIRELSAQHLTAVGIGVDVICGGFPCQDISLAGKGEGIEGARSGLWSEYARIIGEVRPRYVIVENVAALLARGFHKVLGDLSSLGYDAEWHCIPASAVGAPHRRDRLWLVAYASGEHLRHEPGWLGRACGSDPSFLGNDGEEESLADSEGEPIDIRNEAPESLSEPAERSEDVAHAASNGRQPRRSRDGAQEQRGRQSSRGSECANVSDTDREPKARITEPRRECGQWDIEPDVGRVAHGVPSRVDRLRCLGNAVVPQIPEMIGRAIMALR